MILFGLSLTVLVPLGLSTPPDYPYFNDEGSTLHAAERIAGGEHLYRDLLYFKAPLSYYGLGWLFLLFPLTLETARLAGAVVLAALVTGSALLATTLSRRGRDADALAWILGGVVWVASIYVVAQRVTWHNSWCASLASLTALVLYVTTGSPGRTLQWILVGCAVGMTALTKQTFGAAVVVGIIGHRLTMCALRRDRSSLSPAAPIALGLVGTLGLWAAYMYHLGGFTSFVQLAVLYPLNTPALASSLATPIPPIGLTRDSVLFYGPPLLLVWLGARVLHSRCDPDTTSDRLAYVVLALGLYLTLFPSANYSHLRPILPITLIVIAPWAREIAWQLPRRVQTLGALGVLLMCLTLAAIGTRSSSASSVPLALPRSGAVTGDRAIGTEMRRLVDTIDRLVHPREPIFVVPWGPLVYFLSDRPNPTRTRIIGPGQWNAETYQREFIDDLETQGVRLVIRVRREPGSQFDHMERYASILAAHVSDRFEQVARVGRFDLLMRRTVAN